MTQVNTSIMIYFTKLKRLWNELTCLKPLPICECGASKQLDEISNEDKLILFLMG